MKNILFIVLLSVSCLSFGQTRNLKTVKAPVENQTAEKRRAVVIGMNDYGEGRSLNNTLNDANDMVDVLTRLGFEVTLLMNNDLRNLETNLAAWYNTIERNDMAIFYFAGHGVEVGGSNFLIPINAELNSEPDVRYNALSVNKVLDNMDFKQVRFKLLILDACRDNPFTRGWNRSNNEKGLAHINAPIGTLIAFAAAPGAVAHDGGTYNLQNGVFTHFLKQEILTEGASIDDILNRVAGDVIRLTNNQQAPYKTGILTENFYFKPGKNDRPVEVAVIDKPVEPVKPTVQPTTTEKYYYYIDQNGNESQNRFDDRKDAESEMRNRMLFGRIYSNAGEVFVVDKPVEPITTSVLQTEQTKTVSISEPIVEIWNPDGIEMVFVEGGTFMMGCTAEQGNDCIDYEYPSHQVTVSDFYIGRYEVTQGQWKAIMGTNPSGIRKGDNYPVEKVSWNDVQEFIRRLNVQTGNNYRLPTEAEWEFAARGGNRSQGYMYSGSNNVNDVAWYNDNSGRSTHSVGLKHSNELGIYDMSGNVMEWCNDRKGKYSSSSKIDPTGALSGNRHIFRGGSWAYNKRHARVSHRYYDKFERRKNDYLGFRLAHSSK